MVRSDIKSAFLDFLSNIPNLSSADLKLIDTMLDSEINDVISKISSETKSLLQIRNLKEVSQLIKTIEDGVMLTGALGEANNTSVLSVLKFYLRFLASKEYVKTKKVYLEGEEFAKMHCHGRERNTEARQACIDYFKTLHEGRIECECCHLDLTELYGELAEDFIEVHHRFPISQTEGEHQIDEKKDLVPLCPNCHSMIHRELVDGECMQVEKLQEMMKKKIQLVDK